MSKGTVSKSAKNADNFWDEVPDKVKASIKRGLKESKAGLGYPHEEVMKKYNK